MPSETEHGKIRQIYPRWLKDFLILMSATYGTLWSNQMLDDETTETIKRLWYYQLKDYSPDLIREAILHISKTQAYPPKPSELRDVLKYLGDRKRDEEYFRLKDEARLLPSPKMEETLIVLQAKVKMWESLGNHKRAQECRDAIEKRNCTE